MSVYDRVTNIWYDTYRNDSDSDFRVIIEYTDLACAPVILAIFDTSVSIYKEKPEDPEDENLSYKKYYSPLSTNEAMWNSIEGNEGLR